MSNHQKLSTTYSDESLYDVIVHTDEDRKKHKECYLDNHSVYLLIQDVSENYVNDMENNIYYECVCLECGRMGIFKMSIGDRRKVVNPHLEYMASLMSFYDIRRKYLELKCEQLSDEEISNELNTYYDSLQEKPIVKEIILK